MRINPMSEKEADEQSANLWPDGTYDYQVKSALEETSAAGNDMFKLEVWIFNAEGDRKMLFDYLVNSERAAWKIRHFAASCGLLRSYENGTLMEGEMVDRTGRCTIGTQPAKDGYPAKNVIRGYLKREGASEAPARPASSRAKAPAPDLDDEVPF